MSTKSSRPPQVAIIGRPNVGKSTLFNILTRSRKAVVKNQPGVTRDIIVEPAEWWGKKFDVVDTGGLTEAKDSFSTLIREHVVKLISSFDFIICVMDGRVGLVPEDRDVIRLAKESGKPFVIAVNKIDSGHQRDVMLSEFYEFGVDVLGCSFEKRDGVDELVEWVIQQLPTELNTQRQGVRLSIVGKPNSGKSSLFNRLLGQDRVLVSEIAGTTIDSIEAQFSREGKDYIIVDTAGLRKQRKRNEGLEKISAAKSFSAIDKSDIVLLMVDGTKGVTEQDAKMLNYTLENHKGVLLVVNKLDLGKAEIPEFRKKFREDVENTFHFFKDIRMVFISAKTGAGLENLFSNIDELWQKLNFRISTSKLNDFFYSTIRQAPAPVYGTQNVKFYYLTQTQQMPPSFIAFANHPKGVTPSYRRFLSKKIQEQYDLKGVPVRIFVMGSKN